MTAGMLLLIILAVIFLTAWHFLHRGVRRVAGGGMRLIFAAALVVGFLAVAGSGRAFGAESAPKPWTECGSTVTWAAVVGSPAAAQAAITAAYAAVNTAGATLTVRQDLSLYQATATTVWAWSKPGVNVVRVEADKLGRAGTWGDGAPQIEHDHAAVAPAAGPVLSAQILADVGRDLGVPVFTGDGHGGLSVADAAAVKAVCAATPTAVPTQTAGAASTTVVPPVTVVHRAAVPDNAVTARQRTAGLAVAGLAAVVAVALGVGGSPWHTSAGVRMPAWSRRFRRTADEDPQ